MNIMNNSDGKLTEKGLNLDRMLLYIRGGSIFARKDFVRRSSNSMRFDPYTLVVALDRDNSAQGILYIDDGDSYDYQEKQAYARIHFSASLEERGSVLNLKLNVEGTTSHLSSNILNANRLFLVQSTGFQEVLINLQFKSSNTHKLKLN